MCDYIKSPINYMGCKYNLLDNLLNEFPDNINTFIDVFGGSGTVTFNVKANNHIYNDYIPFIGDIFNTWKNMKLEDILIYYKQFQNITEQEFLALRKEYNKTKDAHLLFILICNSFNGQMRFNSKLEYNSSYAKGIRYLNDNILNNITKCYNLLDGIEIINKDFREIDYKTLTSKDLCYFDPPYLLSTGVYQDGKRGFKGWSTQDDIDLMNICDLLNSLNIKFVMSNVFRIKNNTNDKLIEWAKKYKVSHITSNYNIGARKKIYKNDDEVIIKNYDYCKIPYRQLF